MDNADSIHLVHRIRMAPISQAVIIFDQAIATARAEALREAAERAIVFVNEYYHRDDCEYADELRAAILADNQEDSNV